jgi:hypothetical protein
LKWIPATPRYTLLPHQTCLSYGHASFQQNFIFLSSFHQNPANRGTNRTQGDQLLILSSTDYSRSSFEHESCSADELFSSGILLSLHVKERFVAPKEIHGGDSCEPWPLAPLLPLPCDKSMKYLMGRGRGAKFSKGEGRPSKKLHLLKKKIHMNLGRGFGQYRPPPAPSLLE